MPVMGAMTGVIMGAANSTDVDLKVKYLKPSDRLKSPDSAVITLPTGPRLVTLIRTNQRVGKKSMISAERRTKIFAR